jgi:uncharacterized protein YutE (UPF0331/DUF86 family)
VFPRKHFPEECTRGSYVSNAWISEATAQELGLVAKTREMAAHGFSEADPERLTRALDPRVNSH